MSFYSIYWYVIKAVLQYILVRELMPFTVYIGT